MFPVMPSYQRMLVHRVAAFFGMDHNVDQTGSCVIVNVTPSTRIPDIRFSDLIRQDGKFSEEPRRCILKRDSNSFEEGTQLRVSYNPTPALIDNLFPLHLHIRTLCNFKKN